jgi:PTS system nitrogen regulatory IIA component
MKIVDYLDERLICFLDVESRDEAIDQLIDSVHKIDVIPSDQTFRTAVLHREQIVSTGIGMGVAIPHAKLVDLDDFFIAIGIQRKKGIDWNSLDKAPVRLIFLIGGPDQKERQSEYLRILSQLTMAIKDVERRKEILVAQTAEEVFNLFVPKNG